MTPKLVTVDRLTTFELATSNTYSPLFWRAKYLRDDPFIVHLPFAWWLIDASRPRNVVQLGFGAGVAYFGFCQAIDKINADTRIRGFDSWSQEEVGNGKKFKLASDYNTENYDGFSQLFRLSAEQAAARVEPGSVDLLSVDMEMAAQDIALLRKEWFSRLSERGVVLLHGYNTRFSSAHGREFLAALQSQYETAAFDHGDGLLVVLVGGHQNEGLTKLAGMRAGESGFFEVHNAFRRLGMSHRWEWQSRALEKDMGTLKVRQREIEAALAEATSVRDSNDDRIKLLSAAYEQRNALLLELQSALFDARQAEAANVRQRKAEKAGLQTEIATLRDAVAAGETTIAALSSERDRLLQTMERAGTELAEAKQEAVRLNDLYVDTQARLGRDIETLRVELEGVRSEQAQATDQVAGLTAETERLNGMLAKRDQDLADAIATAESLSAELGEIRGHLADMTAARDALATTMTQAENTYKTEIDDLKASLDNAQAAARNTASRNQILAEEHGQAIAQAKELEDALRLTSLNQADSQAASKALKVENLRLDREMKVRFTELAELTVQFEKQRKDILTLKAALAAAQAASPEPSAIDKPSAKAAAETILPVASPPAPATIAPQIATKTCRPPQDLTFLVSGPLSTLQFGQLHRLMGGASERGHSCSIYLQDGRWAEDSKTLKAMQKSSSLSVLTSPPRAERGLYIVVEAGTDGLEFRVRDHESVSITAKGDIQYIAGRAARRMDAYLTLPKLADYASQFEAIPADQTLLLTQRRLKNFAQLKPKSLYFGICPAGAFGDNAAVIFTHKLSDSHLFDLYFLAQKAGRRVFLSDKEVSTTYTLRDLSKDLSGLPTKKNISVSAMDAGSFIDIVIKDAENAAPDEDGDLDYAFFLSTPARSGVLRPKRSWQAAGLPSDVPPSEALPA